MAPSSRGRGSGRGAGSKRVRAATIIQPPQDPKLNSWTLRDDHSDTLSDDSTQPPDRVSDTCFDNPIVAENPHVVPNRNDNEVNVGSVHVPLVVPPKKRGRGPAKCTEFDKLCKHGKIPLKINDGHTAPCCENATMFTTRVTWILKHHGDMSYARWSDVPEAEKDELIDRVRGDFIFDWDLKNHQKTVWKQLRKRFNAFHHQLHKKYLEYATHEEALANRCSLVEPLVWVKLCGRWGSEAFKKVSKQNIENRKKLKTNHTTGRKSFVRILEEKGPGLGGVLQRSSLSKKKGEFVTSTTEDLYKQMVGKLSDLEPEVRTAEAAAGVFRDVLGHRSGYARGLGEMIIPECPKVVDRENHKHLVEAVEKHQKEAEQYKTQLDELRGDVRTLLERQVEYDKFMNSYISERQSQGSLVRETLPDA